MFCEIVSGTRPAHVVHETGATIAFLDQFRQPSDMAHVLVIPRTHIENIYSINDALGGELFAAHARVARAIKSAFAPDGITTWSSNDRGADQEVMHFHLHVWPRRIGVPFPPPIQKPESAIPDAQLGPGAERIRQALGSLDAGSLRIAFHPVSDDPSIVAATDEYEDLWESQGLRILPAFARLTGLRFSGSDVDALVHEAPSRSHPLQLRASYDRETKLGTLIHELAHRLVVGNGHPRLASRRPERASHELIYLFVFDIWSDLYGEEFARRQVEVESRRRSVYAEAWQSALSKDRPAREAALREALSDGAT